MAISLAAAPPLNVVTTFPSAPKVVSRSPGAARAGLAVAIRAKTRTTIVVVITKGGTTSGHQPWPVGILTGSVRATLPEAPLASTRTDPDPIVVLRSRQLPKALFERGHHASTAERWASL